MSVTPRPVHLSRVADLVRCWESAGDLPLLAAHHPLVVRLDGVAFRTLAKAPVHRDRRPFDARLSQTMRLTAADLVEKFGASLAYTISDEVTVVLPAQAFPPDLVETAVADDIREEGRSTSSTWSMRHHDIIYGHLLENKANKSKTAIALAASHIYNGRRMKIVSVLASYATARFHHHYRAQTAHDCDPPALFDARLFPLTSGDPWDVVRVLLWRQKYDGYRNAVNTLGQHVFGHKRMQGLRRAEVESLLMEECGLDLRAWLQEHTDEATQVECQQEMTATTEATARISTATEATARISTATEATARISTTKPPFQQPKLSPYLLSTLTPAHFYGTFAKKERYTVRHGESESSSLERTRVALRSFDWKFNDEREAVRMVFDKYW